MKVITIGRSSENDIIIEDVKVSRTHLQLVQKDNGSYSVVDLNSANGTYVNDKKINGEAQLQPNDTIRIGDTIIPWQGYFMSHDSQQNNSNVVNDKEDNQKSKSNRIWLRVAICTLIFLAGGIVLFVYQNKKGQQKQDSIRQEYEVSKERLQQEAEQLKAQRLQDEADEELFREELREDRDKNKAIAVQKQKEAENAKKEAADANEKMTKAEAAKQQAEAQKNEANKKREEAEAAKQQAESMADAAKKAEAEAKKAKENAVRESEKNKLSLELTEIFYSEKYYESLNKQMAKKVCEKLYPKDVIDGDAKTYLRKKFNEADNEGKQSILKAILEIKQGASSNAQADSSVVATSDSPSKE